MKKREELQGEFDDRFDILRRRRKELKLTLRELADIVGVSRQAVCDWEHGRFPPTGENWSALKKILGLPGNVEDYFGRKASIGRQPKYNENTKCIFMGCGERVVAKKMCRKHYQFLRYHVSKEINSQENLASQPSPASPPASSAHSSRPVVGRGTTDVVRPKDPLSVHEAPKPDDIRARVKYFTRELTAICIMVESEPPPDADEAFFNEASRIMDKFPGLAHHLLMAPFGLPEC